MPLISLHKYLSKERARGWSLVRRVRALRAIAASLLLGATGASVFAQVMVIPAPALRYERMPAPRPDHEWRRGHWQWRHGSYAWAPGYWAAPSSRSGEEDAFYRDREPVQPPRVERLSADALFPFDRGDVGDLTAHGRAELAKIAARLRSGNYRYVEVRGYTDRLGAQSYNQELSQRRADAVKAILANEGVTSEKIRAIGLGEQDPIVQCGHGDSPSLIPCLQPNRRVEIVTYATYDPRWDEQRSRR